MEGVLTVGFGLLKVVNELGADVLHCHKIW